MKRQIVVTCLMSTLFGIAARAGITVAVTSSTSGHGYLSSPTADVTYYSRVTVTNDLPAYYYGTVSWYIDRSNDDCFFVNHTTVGSYCCAFYGSSRELYTYESGLACPVTAHCESYAYAGGATISIARTA